MTSEMNAASKTAYETNRDLAQQSYGVALPAIQARNASINQSLATGEPQYMQNAYAAQQAGLTEGLSAQGGAKQAATMAASKPALSGGNPFALFAPADIGAMLANAKYGSKFQEGQAAFAQNLNLMNMGLGGAGTTGNAALNASGQQLNAIGMLPNYNQTYANIAGAAAGASSVYGAVNQYNQNNAFQSWLQNGGYSLVPGMTNTGRMLPQGTSYQGFGP
jgi:hypothetical protein